MFNIRNGIVYKVVEKGVNNKKRVIETSIGAEREIRKIDYIDRVIYQWFKFDISIGEYVPDTENTQEIIVDGNHYKPVNGKLEIFKTKEILLQELKDEYLPQIKDADLLGDIEEKTRLQQEYQQKKAELEAQFTTT